jgi:hypothetical protein
MGRSIYLRDSGESRLLYLLKTDGRGDCGLGAPPPPVDPPLLHEQLFANDGLIGDNIIEQIQVCFIPRGDRSLRPANIVWMVRMPSRTAATSANELVDSITPYAANSIY